MGFAVTLLIACLAFLLGVRLFGRYDIPTAVDSLRIARLHHLLLGVLIGMSFPEDDLLFRLFEQLRYSLIGIALVWFGLQAGLDFEFRKFRKQSSQQILSETAQILVIFLILFLAVMVSGPLLTVHLGVDQNLALVALLLAAALTTLRSPEPIFRWEKKTRISGPPHEAFPNPASLILFGAAFPFLGTNAVFRLGPFTFVGYADTLGILLGLGLLMGIALDFIFRSYKDGFHCIYLTLATIATVGGPCIELRLPGIFVGLLGGMWLINTSVRRREVLELTDRTGAVVEPIFTILLGSVIGGYGGGPFFALPPLVPFAIALFLTRGLIRTSVLAAANRLWTEKRSVQEILGRGWSPLGGLAAALAVQALYLPLHLSHNTLIAGTLLAAYLSQTLPIALYKRSLSTAPAPQLNRASPPG